MSEIKAPAQITEEARLPIGLPWAGRVYKVATLRAEMVGDLEAAVDILAALGRAELKFRGGRAEAELPYLTLAHYRRLVRITKVATEDGTDSLSGPDLLKSLVEQGLHVEDGQALVEADQRLGERLPGGSGSSDPAGPSSSPSTGSAMPERKSEA